MLLIPWKLLALLAAAGLAGGCFGVAEAPPPPAAPLPAAGTPTPAKEAAQEPVEAGVRTLAEKLRTPWAIEFAGDAIYISEREGSIVRIEQNGTAERKPVRLKEAAYPTGEAGFLGFVLAPDFAESKSAFAYHTYEQGGRALNRVVRLEERETEWVETGTLLEGIPGARVHDGGRMAFGPDGMLYVTTGDAGEEELAQDLDSLAGKILRIGPAGAVPEDNPFPGSYVYSYGHRNPQGLAWTADGIMYAAEHGPSGQPGGHDEINVIRPGGNYGWPHVYGDAEQQGMIGPLYHSGEPPAIAPSGIAADETGRLYLATLRGETLFRFDPKTQELVPVLQGEGRLRDVAIRGEYLYVLTNNTDGRGTPAANDDRLLRLPLPK
ncbi:PQQ-dependent sugar dehydrogenase [Paenibacillus sp.]|uniref:PQQ-dependent sugar dehydrogenase n=1 Tax=Paenibacillus sp. TaxID=58172 RepID=UPI002D6B84BC|nr:PQQ-dependent sugar dehydrogenase [Paenibacillus sp.]HZG86481.1 PQQ-dependent sugar dehydrogenase [Paenibacillus sp.]